MRTSALERPEAPLASAPFSTSTTRTPRPASACAMLTPLTPPPITTTSAVCVMGPGSAQEPPRGGEPRLGRRLEHQDGVVKAQVAHLLQAPGRRVGSTAQVERGAGRGRLGGGGGEARGGGGE